MGTTFTWLKKSIPSSTWKSSMGATDKFIFRLHWPMIISTPLIGLALELTALIWPASWVTAKPSQLASLVDMKLRLVSGTCVNHRFRGLAIDPSLHIQEALAWGFGTPCFSLYPIEKSYGSHVGLGIIVPFPVVVQFCYKGIEGLPLRAFSYPRRSITNKAFQAPYLGHVRITVFTLTVPTIHGLVRSISKVRTLSRPPPPWPWPLLEVRGIDGSFLLYSTNCSAMVMANTKTCATRRCNSCSAQGCKPSIKLKNRSFSAMSGISSNNVENSNHEETQFALVA
ncbi:hypothetical protein AMTR_s00014p00223710 [Amborella trichopoda]|uniref:Uncharacterized protein n=1 Tax=Amborella trichopoda TaxID=13333 RepID=W1PN12_AMBTC|nr:hypothetical protein AMTR_s00014p00223710 [Amborella trichopoda]